MTGRLLLDTRTLLWVLTETSRLSARVDALIANPEVEVVVSAANAWEIATKTRLGRLPTAMPVVATYGRHIADLHARELPISSEHALKAGALDWDHKDPFDRLLVARAMCESLTLVTKDRAITAFGEVETLW